MSRVTEYVQAVVDEGFRRELDQAENVIRSLPFFAASLALLGTLLSVAGHSLCGFDPTSWFSLAIYACLAMVTVLTILGVGGLAWAVLPRRFAYPMGELAFLDYADAVQAELQRAAAAQGVAAPAGPPALATLDEAVLDDLRGVVVQQRAEAAVINRRSNTARLAGRTVALTGLVLAIALALLLSALIFIRDEVSPGACHAIDRSGGAGVAGPAVARPLTGPCRRRCGK